jgi:hypothetical protein
MVARDAMVEGRFLDLCASTDIVNDEMTRSVPVPRVAGADVVRQSASQHLYHQIGRVRSHRDIRRARAGRPQVRGLNRRLVIGGFDTDLGKCCDYEIEALA